MVARTRLNVTLYVEHIACLVCYVNINFMLPFLYTSPFSVTPTGLETRPTYS